MFREDGLQQQISQLERDISTLESGKSIPTQNYNSDQLPVEIENLDANLRQLEAQQSN